MGIRERAVVGCVGGWLTAVVGAACAPPPVEPPPVEPPKPEVATPASADEPARPAPRAARTARPAAPETVYEAPPRRAKQPPALGPFDEASLPQSKYQLLMTVDRALREQSAELLGRVVMSPDAAATHCPTDQGTAGRVKSQRREGAETLATCLALGDWTEAERLGLDYGRGLGEPSASCGFGKHEVAHLFYGLGETVVRVSVRALALEGRHAIILPVKCALPYTFDADGQKVVLPIATWTTTHPTSAHPCATLPWPAAWDLPRPCPK